MGLRVVIPVAGIGTRLQPHTFTRPKVLVHVAGKPMLGHILEELKKYDVDEVALIIGYRGDDVARYASENFPFKFHFIRQEEMLGLGHAIWMSGEQFRKKDGPILVVLGDTLFEADFNSILNAEEKADWIGVKSVEDPRRFGVVVLDDGKIKAMVEKPKDPPSNLAIVGIYLFQDSELLYGCLDEVVNKEVKTAGEIQLTDALQMMIDKGAAFKPFEIEGWYDCGKPETLLATNRSLLDLRYEQGVQTDASRFPTCIVNPPVAIDEDVTLENSVVGPHVSIGRGATIRDSIVTDSVISEQAEIERIMLTASIVADKAKLTGHRTRLNVGDSCEIRVG